MSGDEPLDGLSPLPDDDGGDSDEAHAVVIEPVETVPGAAGLLAEGFVPLERLTGDTRVVEAWPEEHRRVLPETRPALQTDLDDDEIWFVRSPWPTISPAD